WGLGNFEELAFTARDLDPVDSRRCFAAGVRVQVFSIRAPVDHGVAGGQSLDSSGLATMDGVHRIGLSRGCWSHKVSTISRQSYETGITSRALRRDRDRSPSVERLIIHSNCPLGGGRHENDSVAVGQKARVQMDEIVMSDLSRFPYSGRHQHELRWASRILHDHPLSVRRKIPPVSVRDSFGQRTVNPPQVQTVLGVAFAAFGEKDLLAIF